MKSRAKCSRSVDEDSDADHERNEPGKLSNHVTLYVTLHPEKADETIDPKLHLPGTNRWSSVYEEVTSDIPFAIAVPCGNPVSSLNGDAEEDNQKQVEPIHPQKVETKTSPFYICCSPIGMLIGCIMCVAAVVNVFVCEIVAFVFYGMAAFVYRSSNTFRENEDKTIANGLSMIAYSFLMIFYYSFAMVDSLILVAASVVITEILAATTWILTIFFFVGNADTANQWHQYIRRTCHRVRWAFRSPCQEPARSQMCSTKNESDQNEEDELETVEAQPVIAEMISTTSSVSPTIDDIYEVDLEDIVVK